QTLGLRPEDAADALNDRAEGDDGGDADGDADEKAQQAPPRGARFAHRHPQHEPHRGAFARLKGSRSSTSASEAGFRSAIPRVFSTTLPSRWTSRASAMSANSRSWVTRTIVVPRLSWLSRSRSMMWRQMA